jgi:hypothetical protein
MNDLHCAKKVDENLLSPPTFDPSSIAEKSVNRRLPHLLKTVVGKCQL